MKVSTVGLSGSRYFSNSQTINPEWYWVSRKNIFNFRSFPTKITTLGDSLWHEPSGSHYATLQLELSYQKINLLSTKIFKKIPFIKINLLSTKAFKKIPFIKVLNSAWLWSSTHLVLNKKQKYSSLPDHQLAENFILVFDFQKTTKRE